MQTSGCVEVQATRAAALTVVDTSNFDSTVEPIAASREEAAVELSRCVADQHQAGVGTEPRDRDGRRYESGRSLANRSPRQRQARR